MKPKILVVEHCPRIEKAIAGINCKEFEFHFVQNISECNKFIQNAIPQVVVFDNTCHHFNNSQKETCFSEVGKLKKSLPDVKFVCFYDHLMLMGCLCITKDGAFDHIFEKTDMPKKIIEILISV